MTTLQEKRTPWFLLPFVALWNLLAFILEFTGRVVGAVLGLALLIVGLILTVLVISAPVGIPLSLFGLLLMIRSFT